MALNKITCLSFTLNRMTTGREGLYDEHLPEMAY